MALVTEDTPCGRYKTPYVTVYDYDLLTHLSLPPTSDTTLSNHMSVGCHPETWPDLLWWFPQDLGYHVPS